MKDEIKEILDELDWYIKQSNNQDINGEYEPPMELSQEEAKDIYDCITNLQEELEDLREDNYAYHQLMKMQNKREYRSKFLKEFQEEFGTNTFPDYDEIYKRYDKMKKRVEYLERSNNRREDEIISLRDECVTNEYELRLDQTKKVFDVLADLISKNETCTYRYLIYDLLGFEHSAYTPLISGMTITNALVDLQVLKEKRGDINDIERN